MMLAFEKRPCGFGRKGSSYEDMLSHVIHERDGKVPTEHPWCTNKLDGVLRLSRKRKVFSIVAGKDRENSCWFVRSRKAAVKCSTSFTSFLNMTSS